MKTTEDAENGDTQKRKIKMDKIDENSKKKINNQIYRGQCNESLGSLKCKNQSCKGCCLKDKRLSTNNNDLCSFHWKK
jgi:hypothetical protein